MFANDPAKPPMTYKILTELNCCFDLKLEYS